jgi:hypothetical protein
MRDRLQLLAAILAQWWHLVASYKALNLLIGRCAWLRTSASPLPSKWPAF